MIDNPASKPSIIQRYPILSFYFLAFILGAGFLILVVKGGFHPIFALGSALSASIAGVIITAVIDGRSGLNNLFKRLKIWRVGIGFWLFSCFYLLPVVIFGSLVNPLLNGDRIILDKTSIGLDIIPLFIGFFFLSGIGQELGWTGFLTHRLQTRHSPLVSSLIRAALAGFWHLPIFLISRSQGPSLSGFPYPEWISQKGFLIAFLIMLMLQAVWAILITWIYNSTGQSLLLVAVLHASEVWTAYLMAGGGINPGNLNNYWGFGGILTLTVVIILISTGNLTNRLPSR